MGQDAHAVAVTGVVIPALARLLPLLLARLVATEDDYAEVLALESERPEDVRPHIYRSRTGGGAAGEVATPPGTPPASPGAAAAPAGDDEEEDDDDGDDGDDVHGDVTNYTARRACAATLDDLSCVIDHGFLLPVLLPELTR